jgi:hypothetical protein
MLCQARLSSFDLRVTTPGQPRGRGKIERLFQHDQPDGRCRAARVRSCGTPDRASRATPRCPSSAWRSHTFDPAPLPVGAAVLAFQAQRLRTSHERRRRQRGCRRAGGPASGARSGRFAVTPIAMTRVHASNHGAGAPSPACASARSDDGGPAKRHDRAARRVRRRRAGTGGPRWRARVRSPARFPCAERRRAQLAAEGGLGLDALGSPSRSPSWPPPSARRARARSANGAACRDDRAELGRKGRSIATTAPRPRARRPAATAGPSAARRRAGRPRR